MLSVTNGTILNYLDNPASGFIAKAAYSYDPTTAILTVTDQSTAPAGDTIAKVHVEAHDKFGGIKRATIAAAGGLVYIDLDAITGNGQVSGFTISNGGSGYSTAPTVALTGGGGTGATAVAVLTAGVVTAIQIVNPGTGYTSAPSVGFSGGGGTGAAATSAILSGTAIIPALNVSKGYAISIQVVTTKGQSKDGSVFLKPGIAANAGQFTTEQ